MDQHIYQTQKDLITAATASSASGLATSQSNIGDMTTKGIEIDLGLVPLKPNLSNGTCAQVTHPIDLLSTPLLLEQMR
jgi:hypothetical protein